MSEADPRIFIVAAEPSGDTLAGELIKALKALNPKVEVAGVGGAQMARQGVTSPFDISELSVFGIVDGLKILNLVHHRAEETAAAAEAFEADAVVLIDSWGFMLRAAWQLEERLPDVPRIKYVAPQVFAARRGRELHDVLIVQKTNQRAFMYKFNRCVEFVVIKLEACLLDQEKCLKW